MRRLVVLLAFLPLACREPAHIDVHLEMSCTAQASGMAPPSPTVCDQMIIGCANFLEARLYEATAQDGPGNILGSRCIPVADVSKPPLQDMCALASLPSPVGLLDSLPEGKRVIFRLRALYVRNQANGCNDDIPGEPMPVLVFDGFSRAVTLDGNDHSIPLDVTTCASCGALPTPCASVNGVPCPDFTCPPGQMPAAFPEDPNCCAATCVPICDPQTNPTCMQVNCAGVVCPPVPQVCPDGSMPLTPAGQCCAECSPPPPVCMPGDPNCMCDPATCPCQPGTPNCQVDGGTVEGGTTR